VAGLDTVPARADAATVSLLRRTPGRALLGLAALVSAGLIVMFATGIGPDVRIRLALGLSAPVEGCTPQSETVRNPPGLVGTWAAVRPVPEGADEIRAARVGSQIVLGTGIDMVRVGDGYRSRARMYLYDPAANRYTGIPDPPSRVDHPLLTGDEENVYLVGGYVDGRATAEAWRYSLARRRWDALPPMPTARGALGGAVVDGRLYAVAGAPPTFQHEAVPPYRTLEILDLQTGTWTSGPPLRYPRHHIGTTVVDGSLYVVGGRGRTDYSLPYNERFDLATQRWTTQAPLPQGSGGLSAVTVGGELVAVGGGDDHAGWVTGATWAYDPGSDRWRRLPDLVHARHGHGAAAVGSRAFVFGGSPCPGIGRSDSAETLDLS
jgi:hypothetical protein